MKHYWRRWSNYFDGGSLIESLEAKLASKRRERYICLLHRLSYSLRINTFHFWPSQLCLPYRKRPNTKSPPRFSSNISLTSSMSADPPIRKFTHPCRVSISFPPANMDASVGRPSARIPLGSRRRHPNVMVDI